MSSHRDAEESTRPKPPRENRWVTIAGDQRLYLAAAIGLAPWIVVLALSQPPTAQVHHLPGLMVVTCLAIAGGVVATVILGLRSSPISCVLAAATATLSVTVCWFHVVTHVSHHQGHADREGMIRAVVILGSIALLAGWAAWYTRWRPSTSGRQLPWPVAVLLVAIVVVLVSRVADILPQTPVTEQVGRLKITWVGLDVCELLGFLSVFWTLRRQLPAVILAASVTGTLLVADAVINTLSLKGLDLLSALGFACLELPLAALCYTLAVRTAGAAAE